MGAGDRTKDGQEGIGPPELPPRNDVTLSIVREIGFDAFHVVPSGEFTERIFFLGPQMLDGREEGASATEEAVREFIGFWENQISVARDYLANGRQPLTHRWERAIGHLVGGTFQSDKYRWCPRGFVPLKVTDRDAQPCLWIYAQSHRARDAGFSEDLEQALRSAGFAGVPVAKPVGYGLDFDDPLAQDLLWTYAQRRRERDPSFPIDSVAEGLRAAGYVPPAPDGQTHVADCCYTPSELRRQAHEACPCDDPDCGVIVRCADHPEAGVIAKYHKNKHSIVFTCAECDEDLQVVHLDERAHAQ